MSAITLCFIILWLVIIFPFSNPHTHSNPLNQLFELNQSIAQGRFKLRSILEDRKKGCYFQLLQGYVQSFFPRDLGVSSNRLDVDRALRMTGDADKFLRIMIEMWLERNSVLNPDIKVQQPEPTDIENKLYYHYYELPSRDSLRGLIVVVTYLLARKAEVDVASQQSRTARIVHFCPALQALHQPMFIFLVLAFRSLSVTSVEWSHFFLVVHLWLVWIDPSQALLQTFGESAKEKSREWRRGQLKAYVTSNLHFYTTLLALFLRKAREALGSDPSRQWLVLSLVGRVLEVFVNEDLASVLRRVCEVAQHSWEYGNALRGRDYLMHHLKLCRLLRSRPCLLAEVGQDAHHLAAEIQPNRVKAAKSHEVSKQPYGQAKMLLGKVVEFFHAWVLPKGETEQDSGGSVNPDVFIKTVRSHLC